MNSMQSTSLKQILRSFISDCQKRLAIEAPQPHTLRAAVAELSSTGEAHAMSKLTIEQIQRQLASACEDNSLKQLSHRDLRQGCQVWFLGNQPPGRTRSIATAVVNEVADRRLRSAFMALIDAYLNGFDENDPDVAWLGQQLRTLDSKWQWRQHDVWPDRLKRYPLFDPKRAVEKVAEAVFRAGPHCQDIFVDIGLESAARSHTGFEEAVFRAVCRMVSGMAGTNAAQSQKWLIDWAAVGDHTMAFPKSWPDFAGALFLPWQNQEPEKTHQTKIMDTAIRYAGDPRITPLRWKDVQTRFAAAYSTVLRWLTEASVKQFFDIVSRMLDGNDSAMWEARRKFWTAYLDAGYISAAWVVFGNVGQNHAKQAVQLTGSSHLNLYGKLIPSSGKSAQHSTLLMRIRDMTIAEWSHSGKCNFWTGEHKGHPILFKKSSRIDGDYLARELMSAPIQIAHIGDWQQRFSTVIREHTGIPMRLKSRASILDVR